MIWNVAMHWDGSTELLVAGLQSTAKKKDCLPTVAFRTVTQPNGCLGRDWRRGFGPHHVLHEAEAKEDAGRSVRSGKLDHSLGGEKNGLATTPFRRNIFVACVRGEP